MIFFHIILLWLSILKYCECRFFHLQVHDIGLEKRILAVSRSHPAAKSRFIYSRGKLHQLPTSIMSLVKRQPLFSKSLLPLILREPFVRRKQDDVDESVYDFFKRRMSVEVHVEMSRGFLMLWWIVFILCINFSHAALKAFCILVPPWRLLLDITNKIANNSSVPEMMGGEKRQESLFFSSHIIYMCTFTFPSLYSLSPPWRREFCLRNHFL